MKILERIEQVAASIGTYLAVAAVGGVGWIVRRVFTNQRQIEMLQREIEHRDLQREITNLELQREIKRRDLQRIEDRALLGETRDDVREIRKVLLQRKDNG